MDRRVFSEKFGTAKTIFPVIHMLRDKQCLYEAETAMECGAGGVFVIGDGRQRWWAVIRSAQLVKKSFPELFVGANLLDMEPEHAAEPLGCAKLDAMWTDSARMNMDAMERLAATPKPPPLYFGGVAFKYREKVEDADLESTAREAKAYMDVVTTSGDSTGSAPAPEKIDAMRRGTEDSALAIASGVSARNIASLDADAFLVATSIEKDFYHVDPDKLKELIEKASA